MCLDLRKTIGLNPSSSTLCFTFVLPTLERAAAQSLPAAARRLEAYYCRDKCGRNVIDDSGYQIRCRRWSCQRGEYPKSDVVPC